MDQKLREAIDRYCGDIIILDPCTVAKKLQEEGFRLTISELAYIQTKCVDPESYSIPIPILQFFCKMLEAWKAEIIIDPMGENGLLGAYVAERLVPNRVDIVSIDPKTETCIGPLKPANVQLHIGPMKKVESSLSAQYDAIISVPPIGLKKREIPLLKKRELPVRSEGGEIVLYDYLTSLVLAYMASRLSPGGFIIYAVPPSFAWDKGRRSVRQNLEKLGLHLSALLEFRVYTFFGNGLPLYLAVIGREKFPDLFVARVPDEPSAQDELINRLLRRKNSPYPSTGRLINPENFHGLEVLEARERYTRLAKGNGRPIIFTKAVIEIRSPVRRGSEFTRCEEHPHAVYLPEMARTKATTRQDDLPPGLKSYYQLITNPSEVQPGYLAQYLNTPLGYAWRQSVRTGATIPRINEALMADSKFYLPSTTSQNETLQATNDIGRMLTELKELEQRLWEEPQQASKTIDAIKSFNNEERFNDWLDTLPFPLASILRAYYAHDLAPRQKYERLLYFFEAFAAYSAMIHISAFRSSEVLWRQQREMLISKLNENKLNLDKASFGTWRIIMESMVSKLRSMLGKEDEASVVCNLYATANTRPLEPLISPELLSLLQRANHYRNIWPGHGGSVSLEDAKSRLRSLEQEIDRFREIVGRKFLEYQLIELHESVVLKGPIYRFHIRRNMGSNPLMEHDWIEITVPAATGSLCLHHIGHDKVLELVPLVQVVDTPQPASYFYNNLENGEAHLISYHLSDTKDSSNPSQLAVPSDTLRSLFNELQLNPNSKPKGVK